MTAHVPPEPRIIHSCVDLALDFTTGPGQNCMNVFQYRYNTIPTAADMLALAGGWWAFNGPLLRQLWTAAIVPQQIKVTDLDNTHLMETATLPLGAGHQGTRGTRGTPSEATASIALRSKYRGKSNRGRKAISGFDSQDEDDDVWGSQLLTWLAQLAANMLFQYTLGGVTMDPVIGSPKLHTTQLLKGATLIDPFVGSQSTRSPEHGR